MITLFDGLFFKLFDIKLVALPPNPHARRMAGLQGKLATL